MMLRVGLALLLLFGVASHARAADVAACVAAADAGQVQRDERKLSEARASFLICADARCPGAVRKECNGWLAEVEARLPSIVITVRDEAGRDVSGAQVTLDGVELADGSLGRELELDPGPHKLVATNGTLTSELELVASEREQGRIVTLRLVAELAVSAPTRPEPALPAPVERRWLGPVITMSAGVLLVGTAGVLTLSARSKADELRRSCAPGCPSGDVDPLERRLHVADAMLVIGAVAVVSGGVWWLWSRKQSPAAELALSPRGLHVRGRF